MLRLDPVVRLLLATALALVGCGKSGTQNPCADAGDPPSTIDCTGLYTDVPTKAVASLARPYTPAVALWADGAGKDRWIAIPDGGIIDNSDPNDWVFPVGTRAWKEFAREGKRIETRYFHKTGDGTWVYATYAWSVDEKSAARSGGADVTLPSGAIHHIPTASECVQCHRGRKDRLLGFEQVSLGLPGASGITLEGLTSEGRLSPPPSRTSLTIGEDASGHAAAALSWLNVNCGVTCHNSNPDASAYGIGMVLRLDAAELDGRPPGTFAAVQTTVGVAALSPSFGGQSRIDPGRPDTSVVYERISTRGPTQMPPIASNLVDEADAAEVRSWILGPASPDAGADAGAPEADGGTDGGLAVDGGTSVDGGLATDDGGTVTDGGVDGGTVTDGGVDGGLLSDDAGTAADGGVG